MNETEIEVERLILYMNHANAIVRHHERQRRYFLQLHIILTSIFAITVRFLYDIHEDNDYGKFSLILGMILLSITLLGNIVFELFICGRRTKGIEKSNWVYVDTLKKQNKKKYNLKLDSIGIIEDYKKNLKNLYIFEKRYAKCSHITRKITLTGLILMIFFFIISFASFFYQ